MTVITKIKVAAAVLAAMLLAGGLLYAIHVKNDRDEWMLQASTYQQATASLTRELEARDREIEAQKLALIAREAEKERLANEKAALITMLNEVYANDEKARDWAATPCPDGVLDCLLR